MSLFVFSIYCYGHCLSIRYAFVVVFRAAPEEALIVGQTVVLDAVQAAGRAVDGRGPRHRFNWVLGAVAKGRL